MLFGLDQYGAATFDRRPGRAPTRTLGTCEARLTLASGDATPTTDQTGKSTVYLTPFHGSKIELFDTTVKQWVARDLTAEISIAVPSTVFRLFDLFAYWTGSAIALEAVHWNQSTAAISAVSAAVPDVITSNGHGLANDALVGILNVVGSVGTNANVGLNGRVWTVANVAANTFECQGSDGTALAYASDGDWYSIPNTRATALATQNGRYVKTGDASRLYVGTGMTHGTSGQTEDSVSRRLLWNCFNRRPVPLRLSESTNDWNYSAAAFRPLNNRIANRLEFVLGLQEDAVAARAYLTAYHDSSAFEIACCGIGVKQTDASDAQKQGGFVFSTNAVPLPAEYEGHPGLGYSYLQWLERASGSGTTTWLGDSAADGIITSSLTALVWC